jgi:hypothetical protein
MVLSIAAARFCPTHAHHEYIAAWPAEGPSLLAWPDELLALLDGTELAHGVCQG